VAKKRQTHTLSDAERARRSVQVTIRNTWAKEGKPGGETELKRRRTDPAVLIPLYEKKGFEVPAELATSSGKPKPPRPAGSPKKGPPQPPAPPKKKGQKVAPPTPQAEKKDDAQGKPPGNGLGWLFG